MSKVHEAIFTHAIALHQSGRLKNTIHCKDDKIYVLNSDKTVLLRFTLPSREKFTQPISFDANDYDSSNFEIRDNRIVFLQKEKEYSREKICIMPDGISFKELDDIFEAHESKKFTNHVHLHESIIRLLGDGLSHLEIFADEGSLNILQRDIYTGNLIKIHKRKTSKLSVIDEDKLTSFNPIGIRTNDFIALYTFNDKIKFSFLAKNFCMVTAPKLNMTGILAGCVYDELGVIEPTLKGDSDGRKKQEVRTSEQEVSPKTNRRTKKERDSDQGDNKRTRRKRRGE